MFPWLHSRVLDTAIFFERSPHLFTYGCRIFSAAFIFAAGTLCNRILALSVWMEFFALMRKICFGIKIFIDVLFLNFLQIRLIFVRIGFSIWMRLFVRVFVLCLLISIRIFRSMGVGPSIALRSGVLIFFFAVYVVVLIVHLNNPLIHYISDDI